MPRSFPCASATAPRARRKPRPVGLFERAPHRAFEFADVVGAPCRRRIGHLRRLHEIARPNFFTRDPCFARAGVDQPFQHIGRFRPSRAAIGVDRHRVAYRQPCTRAINLGDVVGPGRHRRAEPGNVRPELRQIGAEIGEDVDAQREKLAVVVERHFGLGDVVASLRIAEEMLGAVGDPAHRSAAGAWRLRAAADIRDR